MHKWQKKTLDKFDDGLARFFLLRWHRRARKTTLLLNLLIREAIKNPRKVYGYIGPTYKQAKAIIWRDPNMLDRYLPPDAINRKNESELYIEFKNKSILQIKGADDPDSLRGIDWEGLGIDEWALMKPSIWEEILRPVITQSDKRWAMFAFTPKGRNHAFDYWEKSKNWPDWYRSELRASQSGILPQVELDKARKEMKLHSLYDQEFECSFLADEEHTLILAEEIEALQSANPLEPIMKKLISCDPSQGGDECVVYAFENSKITHTKYLNYKDPIKIAHELNLMGVKLDISDFAIDSIGIGAGVVGKLKELKRNVMEICSAEVSNEKDRFYNIRAEMWWYVAEKIVNMEIRYPEDLELRRQLSAVKCKVIDSNGKIQLEPKHMTKRTLGRSPDRADAFVYGIWSLQDVQEYEKEKPHWITEYRQDVKQTSHMSA